MTNATTAIIFQPLQRKSTFEHIENGLFFCREQERDRERETSMHACKYCYFWTVAVRLECAAWMCVFSMAKTSPLFTSFQLHIAVVLRDRRSRFYRFRMRFAWIILPCAINLSRWNAHRALICPYLHKLMWLGSMMMMTMMVSVGNRKIITFRLSLYINSNYLCITIALVENANLCDFFVSTVVVVVVAFRTKLTLLSAHQQIDAATTQKQSILFLHSICIDTWARRILCMC